MSSIGDRTLRAAALGAVVFVLLGLVLLAVFASFLYPSLEEFEREGAEPAAARLRLAVVVTGLLAALASGFLAARASIRHRDPLPSAAVAAVGPPFVLGAIYAVSVAEEGFPLAALIACPLGALVGLGVARSRGRAGRA